jgi:DNA modification methylase
LDHVPDKQWVVHYHSSERMPEIRSSEARIAIASPPFTNNPDGRTLDKADYLSFLSRVFLEGLRVLMPGGVLVSVSADLRDHARYNGGKRQFDGLLWQRHCDIRRCAESVGFRCFDTKIWAKSLNRDVYRYTFSYVQFFQKSGGQRPFLVRTGNPSFDADVWLLEKGTSRRGSGGCVFRDAIHPEIVSRCLERFTMSGDLVVSPFAGSGTVLSVADLMGRRCIGYETDRELKSLIRESIEEANRFPAYSRLLNVPGTCPRARIAR